MKPRIVVAAAPSASATLFRKWMFLQPRSRHSAVLHPPYYYRRYFGSHTDHSLLSLVPCPISPRLGSVSALSLARSIVVGSPAPLVKRRSMNLTLPSPRQSPSRSLSLLRFDYFSDSQGAPTKWLFRGCLLFRRASPSLVVSSRQ